MFETSEKRTGKLQRNEEKTGQTNKQKFTIKRIESLISDLLKNLLLLLF